MKILNKTIMVNHRGKAWELIKIQTELEERMFLRRQLWELVEADMDLFFMVLSPSSTWLAGVK